MQHITPASSAAQFSAKAGNRASCLPHTNPDTALPAEGGARTAQDKTGTSTNHLQSETTAKQMLTITLNIENVSNHFTNFSVFLLNDNAAVK